MKGRGLTGGFVLSLLVAVVMVLTVGAAGAATITWDFSTPVGDVGTTETYSSGGYNILASGFKGVGFHSGTTNFTLPASGVNTASLFGNGDSLGVVGETSNNTIDLGEIIQLDLVNLIGAGFTNETATVVRLVGGDVAIYGSNTPVGNGVTGTYLASFAGTGVHTFALGDPGAYRYQWFYVRPNAGHVALDSLTADLNGGPPSVPEPSTLLLLGSGLVGLLGYGKRRMKK